MDPVPPPATPLTDSQKQSFQEMGFFIFDPGFGDSVLSGAVADLQGRWRPPSRTQGGVYFAKDRIQDAWKISPHVKAIATHPVVLRTLEQLFGRKALPFQTLNFPQGTEQRPHSDTVHFNSDPPGFMCGVWVALEDIDMANGPLVYYPGSHRLPEVTLDDLGPEVKHLTSLWHHIAEMGRELRPFNVHARLYHPFYEPYIGALIERQGLKPEYGIVKRGQALIWAANLLHGGSLQTDKSRSRHSQVTHYYFEGCRYYTPLRQTTDLLGRRRIRWRRPKWIV